MIHLPNDPLKGGVPLQKVPIIPWSTFLACGLKVYFEDKIQVALFVPQPMESLDEAVQTLCLLLAASGRKPGPLDWNTVPEHVRKHFKFPESKKPGDDRNMSGVS